MIVCNNWHGNVRTEKIEELLLAIRSKIVCWLEFAGRVLLHEVEHAACTKGMMIMALE
jgi:hypothetical protein